MAIAHVVAGPVIVTWNNIQLGYTRDGAQLRIEPRWGDVHSDDYGGAGGAPADTQLLGAIATVTAELTKYEAAEVYKLSAFSSGGAIGTLPVLGTLIRQDTKYATLLLNGSNEDWTATRAFPRSAIEVNKGTKFSTAMVGFECWIDAPSTRVFLARATA